MLSSHSSSIADKIQSRLLGLAALFLFIYSVSLTISPAVIERTWEVDYRWGHWLGFSLWLALIVILQRETSRRLPDRDPLILPIAALLSGWGLLAIWRLYPFFGLRQSLWTSVAMGICILGLRLPSDLGFLRRYKYLWLTGGLLLTALTLVLGTNPMGYGPRLWLGCCGFYIQPSEPLKLLLIIYLSAYLADRQNVSPGGNLSYGSQFSASPLLPLLAPTLIMAGLALLLLLVQRDLGTASIFLFLYATISYISTGRKRILLFAVMTLLLAGFTGYLLFDVVRIRVDAWLNPWLDPSGRSYQIVQSLLAVANGGLLGRGPGLGFPEVVPIPHSDFIYATLAEESGLIGSLGLLILISLLATRGLRISLHAHDTFHRYLAGGLTAYLIAQSILIISGNLRLLPLTGVTLPFVSYGGSSLLTSFIALLLLLHISTQTDETKAIPKAFNRPYLQLGAFLLALVAAVAFANGWWSYHRGPDLLTRTDNPRRAIDDLSVRRGSIYDRSNNTLAATTGKSGEFSREISYPPLSPILGYTNPTYGQSGLEASLDSYLRGLEGNPNLVIWWNHLLYGQPPPGLDVRLSLDMNLQQVADNALAQHTGALVLLNAESGEILALTSHPYFDANQLAEKWDVLMQDVRSPLLNRATLGRYSTGDIGNILFSDGSEQQVLDAVPQIRLPVGAPLTKGEFMLSPLQVVLAAAPLSAGGKQPAPQLVMAVNTPQAGWILLPSLGEPLQSTSPGESKARAYELAIEGRQFWQILFTAPDGTDRAVTWYVGGTLPDWDGIPLAIALVLEEDNLPRVRSIGQEVLQAAMMSE